MLNNSVLLILAVGLCWITVYTEAVRVSLRDKSYAIPFWAAGLNFSWEALHTFLAWDIEGLSLQVLINAIRGVLSIFVLSAWFRFGSRHFPENPGAGWLVPWGLLVIAVSFVLQYAFVQQFGSAMGGAYAAFLQNFALSLLLIAMLSRRKRRTAQSMIIAVAKLTGSLVATIFYGFLGVEALDGPNNLLLVIGSLSCLFDLIYIALLSQAMPYEKNEKATDVHQRDLTGGDFDAFRV